LYSNEIHYFPLSVFLIFLIPYSYLMTIDPPLLTSRLKNAKSITHLRRHANENASIMSALHDSVICVACGRFGSTTDLKLKTECKEFYLLAAKLWLARPVGSIGREARNVANILQAGGKLGIDPKHDVMKSLLDEAIRMSREFEAQHAANCIWAVASMGVDDTHVVNALSRACIDYIRDYTPQEATNALWALAMLEVSDSDIILALAGACVDRVRDLNPQNLVNSLWAIAKLGVTDEGIILPIARGCANQVKEFLPNEASKALWAIASLKLSNTGIITSLTQACLDRVKDLSPEEAAITLWAIAKLNLSDSSIITVISHACVDHVRELNAQDASNSLWAIARLGVSDSTTIDSIVQSCIDHIQDFNHQDAANVLWAIATLRVSDNNVIKSFTELCINHILKFDAQAVSNSMWAIATLVVSDTTVITTISKACVDHVKRFNPQEASNALWSAAVLNITDSTITNSLALAVSQQFLSLNRLDDAVQCLQAHFSGLTLSKDAVNYFHDILLAHPTKSRASNQLLAISSALSRLGYVPKLGVPVYNGVVTTDISIELPSADNSGRKVRYALVFDGPKHYLRPMIGGKGEVRDRVGPIDGKTCIRNALLKRCNVFEVVISIPYYEWNDVPRDKGKEEEYLKKKMIRLT